MFRGIFFLFLIVSPFGLKAQAGNVHSQNSVASCNADFTTIDSMGYIFFVNNSTLGSAGVYFWDFGDGFTSTQYNPSHIYDSTGTFLVCLTAYDSLQNFCDSTCHYVTVTNLLGVHENKNRISELTLAPNPSDANANFSFYLSQPSDATFSVFDVSGRMVREISSAHFSTGKQNLQINTGDFSPGVYFIKSNLNGEVTTTKMIVSHQE